MFSQFTPEILAYLKKILEEVAIDFFHHDPEQIAQHALSCKAVQEAIAAVENQKTMPFPATFSTATAPLLDTLKDVTEGEQNNAVPASDSISE